MANPDEVAASWPDRRPVVLRGGTVLTMDDAHTVLVGADVLVAGDRIAAVGPHLDVPEGTAEIDASGGIVMPGMIDTHRHMWQTAMRAYGADWTLTQYFVWNYLEHGRKFRPEDIHAGNLISAWEALEAGVTTTVDWSHNLHTPTTPRRPSTRCARCPGGSSSPTATSRPAPGSGPPTPPSGRSSVGTPRATCSGSRSPSTSPATRPSRRRRPSSWPASSACRSPPTPECGAPPTTTASG